MTIPLGELELSIYNRLNPLLEALNEAEIPLILLPKNAAAYNESNSEHGLLSIVIPAGNSVENFNGQIGSQLIQLDCLISMSLPARYHDDEEKQRSTLEYCSRQIIGLLLGYRPDIIGIRYPFEFSAYTLLIPESNYWEATITFNIRLDIVPLIQPGDIIARELQEIALFSVNEKFEDPTKMKIF